jgi:D-sedoheptulose 7-phosphate isomerase
MSSNVERIKRHLTEAGEVLLSSVGLSEQIAEIVEIAIDSLKSGGTIFWCGNGGSAADSQHLAAELIGRYKLERRAISSIALTTDSSILTAISNDFVFEFVFSRQLEGLAREGDVLVALTTSGNSQSILNAVAKAKELKVSTVILTSIKYTGGQGDFILKVASTKTEQIQHAHIAIGHVICELIESSLPYQISD